MKSYDCFTFVFAMVFRVSVLFLFLVSLVTGGLDDSETCNNLTCIASHSYCDKNDICRCKPEYPVHIGLHSCRQEKKYNEVCDYTAECYYYDKNSHCSHVPYRRGTCKCNDGFFFNGVRKGCMKGKKYNEECDYTAECNYYDGNAFCSELPYRSTCECDDEYVYSEGSKRCMKIFGDHPKTSYLVSPTSLGLFFAFAAIICGGFLLWYVCRRPNGDNAAFTGNRRISYSHNFTSDRDTQSSIHIPTAPPFVEEDLPTLNFANAAFSRSRMTSHSNDLTSGRGHHRSVCSPSSPTSEVPLPTYDTALSLKVTADCEPPPSYKEVSSQVSNSKT